MKTKVLKSIISYLIPLLVFTFFIGCDLGTTPDLDYGSDFIPPDDEVIVVDYENGLFVAKTGNDDNDGSSDSPFLTIMKAAQTASEGQSIYVQKGTYDEFFNLSSSISKNISLYAFPEEEVKLTNNENLSSYLINIKTSGVTINGFVIDGNWREYDIIKLQDEADDTTLKNLEIYNSKRDCIDMDAPENVIVDRCKIYNALLMKNGKRDDAHGIVTEGVQNLIISNCEVFYVSGDALQFQYGGWDNITVYNCKLWNGDLPEAIAGFAKGVNPGENAIDTKYTIKDGRGRLNVIKVEAYGWRGDFINNAAAFNIKHNVKAVFDGVTVYDSEIAFRLRGLVDRGNAVVDLMNVVMYDVDYGVRYEDDITDLHIFNCTFGNNISSDFISAGGHGDGFLVQNCLFYNSKPSEASDPSNIHDNSNFVDVNNHDYQLTAGSPAIDAGIDIDSVENDRLDNSRPVGEGYDCGAYEYMN